MSQLLSEKKKDHQAPTLQATKTKYKNNQEMFHVNTVSKDWNPGILPLA